MHGFVPMVRSQFLKQNLSLQRADGELDKTQIPQPIAGPDSFPHWTLVQTQWLASWEVGDVI